MKFVLGLYTQITDNSPTPVYSRVLSCILKPVLTYIHNNPQYRISLAQSSAMIRYLSQHYPEVNLLIHTLARRGRLELFTSALDQTILALVQQKDRATLIDKHTTLIRKSYGVRATTLWCYGQIWTASLVFTMKLIGLERVVINAYDAIVKKGITEKPFRMYELGRKIDVVPAFDSASRLVSSYGQNEISLEELKEGLCNVIKKSKECGDVVFMINMDQLCQGASYHREDDVRLFELFKAMYETAEELGAEFCLADQINAENIGYLQGGWYGRDSSANGLTCFNELFVKNESYRYYLRRVSILSELANDYKKDRTGRKGILDLLASIPSGPMFLCDTNASALRLSEHRHYYKTLLEAENRLAEAGFLIDSADLNDDGHNEEFGYTKNNSVVLSPMGASLLEYNSRKGGINVFDTIAPWTRECAKCEKLRSFTDVLEVSGKVYDLRHKCFELESVNRSRTEFSFSYCEEEMPFEVLKHYRMGSQNLYLSITIVNKTGQKLEGNYNTAIYFTLPEASAYAYDSNRELLVGNALSDIKNVRFQDSNHNVGLYVTSTDVFSAREEKKFQNEVTSLGSERFYLYTKLDLTFKLSVAADSAMTFNIITRVSDSKE